MKIRSLILALTPLLSLSAHSSNDVYGTVDEIFLRTGDNGDSYIAFRLNIEREISYFENCVIDEKNLVWKLDQSNFVSQFQYDLIKGSYERELPIRVIGSSSLCNERNVYSDNVYELSPWSWAYHIANKEKQD